jgi:hypothetical protein
LRVYLPSTLPGLAELLHTGEIGPAPVRGFAVTPALREWYSSGDIEELEYVALMYAARKSLRLLAADPAAPTRRVVLAAELPDGPSGTVVATGGSGFDEPALVHVNRPVQMRDMVSVHIDDLAAASEIGAAVAALHAADAGDEDATFVVGGAEGYELQWYATQEIADLLA